MSSRHDHGAVELDSDRHYLDGAFALTTAFMAMEVVVAIFSGSLALLADAGHMLADAGAIAGSIWAIRLAQRPITRTWSFGLKRAEILAAAGNGITLLVAGMLILVEALRRLVSPSPVHGLALLIVALAGIGVNLISTWILSKANRTSLNVEGAFRHVLTDLYAFVATAVAGTVIVAFGYRRADPIASLLVVALMFRAAWRLLGASGHILLEGTPGDVDLDEVRRHMFELPEIVAVHDLHVWTLTSKLPVLSAHVVVADRCMGDGSAAQVLDRLQECLSGHFDVEHSTFQLELASHAAHEPGAHHDSPVHPHGLP
ncbi:MAG: cation diffusion facilitator family transporter [Acidimicrobiales bacterium]